MRATGCAPRWRGTPGPAPRTGTCGPRAPASPGRSSPVQQVRASACSASRYGPRAAPSRLPVPDSAAATHRTCGNAPSRDWFDGRPKNASFVLAVRHVRHRPVHRDDPQPAAEHPRRPVRPDRPRHLLEQQPHRCRRPACRAPRQRGDVRRPPPPPAARHPPSRPGPGCPASRSRAPPLVIQAVGQLGHHLPVPAVPAPEQPQRQHEVHHQPRRQQPAPLLPRPGRLRRPHPPAPAGTPWSAPRPRSGPAATRPATAPQNHHEPQNGYDITSALKQGH